MSDQPTQESLMEFRARLVGPGPSRPTCPWPDVDKLINFGARRLDELNAEITDLREALRGLIDNGGVDGGRWDAAMYLAAVDKAYALLAKGEDKGNE